MERNSLSVRSPIDDGSLKRDFRVTKGGVAGSNPLLSPSDPRGPGKIILTVSGL